MSIISSSRKFSMRETPPTKSYKKSMDQIEEAQPILESSPVENKKILN